MLVLVSQRLEDCNLHLQLQNLPKIVICFVGNGGVRFREPVCSVPTMASALGAVLSVLNERFHSWD
jgi:hypothetical protein